MSLLQIVVIAVVQGITEFLPISSSGHLVLVPALTDWPDQGLLLDVAVHVGTLAAVVAYLWREVGVLLQGAARIGRGTREPGVRLLLHLIVATVPIVVAGFLVHRYAGDSLRSVALIGWTTLGFGLVLLAADRLGPTIRRLDTMGMGAAFAIGLAQVLALIPGTSRAGITISAARALGYERRDAARFSMLLSIPTIVAAGGLATLELVESGDAALQADALVAAALSFATALIAIAAMMRWLQRATFAPFVVYRILLGGGLLLWVYV